MAIEVEVPDCHQLPADRKRWSVHPSNENIVVEVPDRRDPIGAIEQRVIRMAIAVKIRCITQTPTTARQIRSESAAQKKIVIQIPDSNSEATEHIVRMAIAIKIIALGYVRSVSANSVCG